MGACGDLKALLMMRISPSAGGLLSVLRSPTNNTHLPKESLSVSSRSTALSNSSLTTPWGRRASGVTCSWERNRSAWLSLTVSGILLVKKLKRCVSARRWASFRSTRADETAIRTQLRYFFVSTVPHHQSLYFSNSRALADLANFLSRLL